MLTIPGLLPGSVRLLIMSKLEASRKSLCSSSPAAWHAAPEAVKAPSASAATSHLGTEHLHEDLGVDLHTTTHSTSTEPFHRVH